MIKCLPVVLISSLLAAAGCNENHLIKDKAFRRTVEADFNGRMDIASGRKNILFDILNSQLSVEQEEAIKFLFAYMPLSDLADYTGEFFLANADKALQTRNESPWGKSIPDNIFLHYVLPCRINNENLDSFRIAYYGEIKERITGMSLEDAALEINHWCHEKVTYQPADIRTSGPMSTILSARGRCGEESTFTVAALRTAGIPSRQVYTPRWAHTDDNHAWVEVWIDGTWHYMGACEPEPVLDRGWFTEPARRAMLVHTKSFGAPYGNENAIRTFKYYSDVNNLSNYALTKKIFVKTIDETGNPVSNAIVDYKLYNYAEFYTLASIPTNAQGISSFETGLGDLMIWANKGGRFDYKIVSVPAADTVVLKLDKTELIDGSEPCDLKVPTVQPPFPDLPEDLVEANKIRFEKENLIRQSYIGSWIKPRQVRDFAIKLNVDSAVLRDIFARSMGNFKNIQNFLENTNKSNIDIALSLLNVLNDKDLRDTKDEVLKDLLQNFVNPQGFDKEGDIFINYLLNPRVDNEMLTAYRSHFQTTLPENLKTEAVADPDLIIKYINSSIRIDHEENYYNTPLTPVGVDELKVSDKASRKIYFVSVCRSIGIPARLEPGSNIPQYYSGSSWNDVYFGDEYKPEVQKGFLKLVSDGIDPEPEYYTNFTISRYQNGTYSTLDYDYNKKISDFKDEISLIPGNYMIITGRRLPDGNVLSELSFFTLSPLQHLKRKIELRKETKSTFEGGKIDMEKLALALGDKSDNADLSHGVLLAAVESDREPSNHFLNDLAGISSEFKSWGGELVLLIKGSDNFDPLKYKGFPENPVLLNTGARSLIDDIWISGIKPEFNYPLIIVASPGGDVLFSSSGYRIGTGEQILRSLN